ncbi:MAG: CPBP family intramembrane metalloprotease [Oscillatoriophycideae cyanobacterium NC_groundwater_1537_Pr4_S-0.65um_50_18]|nr:CPBP family intramembrane metalloprotease [Oscillatoriophycideae cyanobacterium NC_groundwater_1537_Pr4_S-0.65um_50_18]
MDTQTDTRTDSEPALFLRVLRFPLTRLLLFIFGLLYVYVSGAQFLGLFPNPMPRLAASIVVAANLLFMYVSIVYLVERRSVSELALPRRGRELGIGLLLGFGLYTTCVVMAIALGLYRIEGFNGWQVVLPSLWLIPLAPVFEELLFRGVVFRILEEVFGGWLALILSSVGFGLMHMGNPGETFDGIAAIAIVFGPMLAASYMLTRRLWLGIGLHGAWNTTMSLIFSGAVSGNGTPHGLFKTTFQGPELLTGGNAGMEGSLIAVLVAAIATVLMLIPVIRRSNIVPPAWKRKAPA